MTFTHENRWVFDKRRRKLDWCESTCLELINALREERKQGEPEGSMDGRPLELTRQILRHIHDAIDDVDMREQADYLKKKEWWEARNG